MRLAIWSAPSKGTRTRTFCLSISPEIFKTRDIGNKQKKTCRQKGESLYWRKNSIENEGKNRNRERKKWYSSKK